MKQQQNISSITKTGLCTGCGMCQTVCPEQAVEINLLDKGWFRARIDEKLCTNCGLCLKVCGRNPEYPDTEWQEPQKENEHSPFLGNFENCYLGHSTDINIRWNATSGGLITSILAFCFKTGLIDCAIVASSSAETPLISRAVIATSEKEILQAFGSRYAPIPINAAIKEALTMGEKIAVVGLPCHIQSIRRAEVQLAELKNKIVLHLGMFCSHNASSQVTDFLLHHKGLKASDVSEFNYRGKGWPSGIRIKTKQGAITYIPNNNSIWTSLFSSFIYATPYCLSCTDQTNEFADISFGDAWLSDVVNRDRLGCSICIARTKFGSSVLEQAIRAKVIKLTNIEPRRVVESQGWPLYFKKINVLCRSHQYPENTIQVDESFRKWRLTFSDRFVSWFASFSSSISNRFVRSKCLSYMIARALLWLSKLHYRLLMRQTSKLISQFNQEKPPEVQRAMQPEEQVGFEEEEEGEHTKILIVNQHGPNRGDEAAFRGMIYGLKKMIPNARFTSLTALPAEDYRHIKGVRFIDMVYLVGKKRFIKFLYFTLAVLVHRFRWKLLSKLFIRRLDFIKAFAEAELVISAPAGPYFGDLYMYGEISCAFNIFLAKLMKLPVMIYAPSMGPFDIEKRNRWRRQLLSRVDVISIRDHYSKTYLQNLGIDTSSISVTVDSCLQKPVDRSLGEKVCEKAGLNTSKMLIGMVVLDEVPSGNLGEKYHVRPLIISTLKLLLQAFEADFVLLPQLYGTFRDLPVLNDIAANVYSNDRIHIISDEFNSDDQQGIVGCCDLFVAFRYHPFIFASRQAVPSVCIAYEHKAFGYAKIMDLQDYCIDLFSTTAEDIVEKIKSTWQNKDDYIRRARENIAKVEELSLKNSKLAAELLRNHKARKKLKC